MVSTGIDLAGGHSYPNHVALYFLVVTKPSFSLFQVHAELPAEKLLDKPVLMSSFSAWISTFDFASSVPCFVSIPVRCGVVD